MRSPPRAIVLDQLDRLGRRGMMSRSAWIPSRGVARVVRYTPRHDLSLVQLGVDARRRCWQEQYRELGARQLVDDRGQAAPECQRGGTPMTLRRARDSSRVNDEPVRRHVIRRQLAADAITTSGALRVALGYDRAACLLKPRAGD